MKKYSSVKVAINNIDATINKNARRCLEFHSAVHINASYVLLIFYEWVNIKD